MTTTNTELQDRIYFRVNSYYYNGFIIKTSNLKMQYRFGSIWEYIDNNEIDIISLLIYIKWLSNNSIY